MELTEIELHLLTSDKLVDVDAIERHYHGQTIRLGDIEDMIDRYHGSRTGHVLRYDLRLPRDIFRHVFSEQASPTVIESSRCRAHHDANCFPFIKPVTLRPDFS